MNIVPLETLSRAQCTLINTTNFVCRLCESEIEHSAALSGAVTALRHDEEARLSSKVENMRQQEKVFVCPRFFAHITVNHSKASMIQIRPDIETVGLHVSLYTFL